MSKWDEIKRICSKRSISPEWFVDMEFVNLIDENFNKIAAVVDAAIKVRDRFEDWEQVEELNKALEALDK